MTTEIQTIELPSTDGAPDLMQGSQVFMGTATVLLRYAGFTILTDPNFLHRGEAVRLGCGIRSTRLTEPAMSLGQLPPLDLVVLSHLHEDHFDRVVERNLDRAIPIVTTPMAAAALADKGFYRAVPLETWQQLTVRKRHHRLRITALPARHGPWALAPLLPPVMGSMLEFESATGQSLLRVYITGDTVMHRALTEIPRRYPIIDQMLLHLGGLRAFGMLLSMDAQQGMHLMRVCSPRVTIPIHYNDYTRFTSSLSDFQEAVREAGLQAQVRYLIHGDRTTFDVPNMFGRQAKEA